MFRTKVTISCLQVVLGLLQHLDPVLDLQSIWGSWNWSQMIPPHPKTLIWYQNYVSSTIQNQSYNFTPWGRSGPSTDPTPCSWSSNRSETPENGLQWFPLPTNIQFDTEIVSQARSEPMSKKSKYLSLIVRFTGLPLKHRQACATSKTCSICIIFGM